MGLNVSHGAFNGSYGYFAIFREGLAKKIGVDLNEMRGFGGRKSFKHVKHKIVPLLNHSDCDGVLFPDQCKQIAEGLDEIIQAHKGSEDDIIQDAIQFRDGCLLAYAMDEVMEFY